jgi:hypothetical protein
MNTNNVLKQKEKLEEELYRYRSHIQQMLATRGSDYSTSHISYVDQGLKVASS